MNNPLESVKDRIATRLLSERRTQALETLVRQLRERTQVHIEEVPWIPCF